MNNTPVPHVISDAIHMAKEIAESTPLPEPYKQIVFEIVLSYFLATP